MVKETPEHFLKMGFAQKENTQRDVKDTSCDGRDAHKDNKGCDGKREEEDDVFKKKLIMWLKENNMKLATTIMGD